MPDPTKFDLDYRPESYFEGDPTVQTLARIVGSGRRAAVSDAMRSGESIPHQLTESKLSSRDFDSISLIHPKFMGGEALPPLLPGEVEVARMEMDTTTLDVTSLRARQSSRGILYRMVDEYLDDGTTYRLCRKSSRLPLTLAQVIEIIETAKQLFNGEPGRGGSPDQIKESYLCSLETSLANLEMVHDFTHVSSLFYPELEAWYEAESEEWYQAKLKELDGTEPEPGHFQWQFRWPPQSTLRELAFMDFTPDDILHISDPPMTEREALEIVERLRREGRMPNLVDLAAAFDEAMEQLSDEEE